VGMYHLFDAWHDKPVYQYQEFNLERILSHIASRGWFIEYKRDISRMFCLSAQFLPVYIQISEDKEFAPGPIMINQPLFLPSVSEGRHHDSIRPNKVQIQWNYAPPCIKNCLTQAARLSCLSIFSDPITESDAAAEI
jgi:hypothetical protein